MTDKKDFVAYIQADPISIRKGRWRKYSHGETEFDRVTLSATWALSGNRSVTIKIIGAQFWDINRNRNNHANDWRLYSMSFKSFKFYGMFPSYENINVSSLTVETRDMLIQRIKAAATHGSFDTDALNQYT